MAEIICIECNASVSDASGHCPECGYPFETQQTGQDTIVAAEVNTAQRETPVVPPPDLVLQSFNTLNQEINALQRTVNDIKHDFTALSLSSADNTRTILTEVAKALESIAALKAAKEAEAQTAVLQKSKENLLATFYKTLNSPNSMFEYMFYLCVAQTVFVIVNLLLVAYIVNLVRR